MTEESYKALLQRIVASHIPDEALVFEVEGDGMVNSLFRDEWEKDAPQGHGDRYGFADLSSVKPVLDIALVALTTFRVLAEIRLLKKKTPSVDREKVRQHWEERLRQSGVKSGKAKAISADFTQELMSLTDRA